MSESSELYQAFQKGDLFISLELLEKTGSEDLKIRLESLVHLNGKTLLHLACHHGWLDVVKLLIEKYECNAIVEDHEKLTPFHCACKYGHLDIVKFLAILPDVLKGVDQPSVLHVTCEYGWCNILIYIMDQLGFTLGSKGLSKKEMPRLLVTACHGDHTQIVHYLIKGISKYQSLQLEECKALFLFCCKHGLLGTLRQLLIDVCMRDLPHITDKSGKSGIHYACQKGHTEIVKHLVEQCVCHISVRDKNGLTPLHEACQHKPNAEIVKYILSRPECDVLALTDDGNTALHLACTVNDINPEIMNNLIKHGAVASKEALSSAKKFLYTSALKVNDPTNNSAIVACLLKAGKCDPNAKNYARISPIQLAMYPLILTAITACHTETSISKWIECDDEYYALCEIKHRVSTHELNLNQTASNGDTALHIACVINKVLIAKYLIYECNFDPNVENNAGDTPLSLALWCQIYRRFSPDKFKNLVSVFVSNAKWNPEVPMNDRDGNNLLHLACQANQTELVSTLKKSNQKLVNIPKTMIEICPLN